MDEFSEENWGSIVTPIAAPGQGPDPDLDRRRDPNHEMNGLRVEYLLDVVRTKEWYDIEVPTTAMNEDGVVVDRTEHRYFQILNKASSHSRPHLMPTVESWEDPILHKKLALYIQESSVREVLTAGEGEGAESSVVVYLDADPRWIGWEDIGPWKSVLQSLTRFNIATGAVGHAGCVRLAAPERAVPVHPLNDFKCPTLCILKELYRRGWNPVRGTVTHESLNIGPIDGREAVSMKAYYIVVLEMARCLPLSSRIPSNQPIPYYKLLLSGKAVEPGPGVVEYRRLMRGFVVPGKGRPPAKSKAARGPRRIEREFKPAIGGDGSGTTSTRILKRGHSTKTGFLSALTMTIA